MKFFIAIEAGDDSQAFGVVVPDLPGCFSAADTLEEAIDNSREAVALHCECLLESGEPLPVTRPLLDHYQDETFAKRLFLPPALFANAHLLLNKLRFAA